MKTLKFRQHLAKETLEGRKTVTWRLFDDKDLKTGDLVGLIVWETKEKFAEAKITNIREKELGKIEEQDFEGHEKFKSREEMMETYKKYYGDRVTPESIVKIISFKIV